MTNSIEVINLSKKYKSKEAVCSKLTSFKSFTLKNKSPNTTVTYLDCFQSNL
jgi:hypothetical protein